MSAKDGVLVDMRGRKKKMKNIAGEKHGRLTVVSFSHLDEHRSSYWNCLCDCGVAKVVRRTHLYSGVTVSCGCLWFERTAKQKGMSKNGLYNTWHHMISRCTDQDNIAWKYYGGRGIRVCDKWLNFVGFSDDMFPKPKDLTLERNDNNGDYSPENCRWASRLDQANNKRNNRIFELSGKKMTLAMWARFSGINEGTIRTRLECGWTFEKSISMPVNAGLRTAF